MEGAAAQPKMTIANLLTLTPKDKPRLKPLLRLDKKTHTLHVR